MIPSRRLTSFLAAVSWYGALPGLGALPGCLVSKSQYEECVARAADAREQADTKQKRDAAQIADLGQRLTAAEAATQERDGKLSELSTESHNLQAQLDEATAMNQQLRGELSRLGRDVDKVLADRGTLAKALEDAKVRLEELRKAQADAEERAQLFRDFAARFKSLVDAGQMRIESHRGQLVMDLSADFVFDEGSADVRSAAKGALMEIARTLTQAAALKPGRRFAVTAHLDGEPPKAEPSKAESKAGTKAEPSRTESSKHGHHKSPWDLTAERAVAVVEYLVSLHVAPELFTAAGAGSYDPIVPNDSPEGRAKNRRIEIALAL